MNIEWARENDYPAEKIQKLNEREEKCKKMKEEHVEDPEDDPWNYFKLSYPANPKIPFIINDLTMKTTAKFGRGIYATRNLNPGDFIAIEEAQIKTFSVMNELVIGGFHICFNCLKSNMLNLLPCSVSAVMMFCSRSCCIAAFRKKPNREKLPNIVDKLYADIGKILGNRDEVMKFIKEFDYKNSKVTIFDFDLSQPDYHKNLLKCFLTFTNIDDIANPRYLKDIKSIIESREGSNKEMSDFMKHVAGVFDFNAFTPTSASFSTTFGGLLNHSCIPNVSHVQVGNKTAFYIQRPVEKGEQLFESYYSFNAKE